MKHIIIFLLIITALGAQEIKIVEIIDANLFRTSDSILISMIDLEVPSLMDQDSSRSLLAEKAIQLARLQLLKQNLRFEETYKSSCNEDVVKKGHLFRKYPLGDANINILYLEKGYAVYSPCDTMYLDQYRQAGINAMNQRLGIWKSTVYASKPIDRFNRFRLSLLLLDEKFRRESFFPPLFGLNYRWSDLITIVDNEPFHLNVSAETGTLVYFVLPYVNLGMETRFSYFYGRVHYDTIWPVLFLFDDYDIDANDFWGFDIGFIIPLKDSRGIEIEFNSKHKEDIYINFISISFTVY
jgi:hypothetical protein